MRTAFSHLVASAVFAVSLGAVTSHAAQAAQAGEEAPLENELPYTLVGWGYGQESKFGEQIAAVYAWSQEDCSAQAEKLSQIAAEQIKEPLATVFECLKGDEEDVLVRIGCRGDTKEMTCAAYPTTGHFLSERYEGEEALPVSNIKPDIARYGYGRNDPAYAAITHIAPQASASRPVPSPTHP